MRWLRPDISRLFISDKYLISLFLFWYKKFWIVTLIILLIAYISGKSKHLIAFLGFMEAKLRAPFKPHILRRLRGGALIGSPLCRETPVNRAPNMKFSSLGETSASWQNLRRILKSLNTIVLWCTWGLQEINWIGLSWCREVPSSRTAGRLVAVNLNPS